MRFPMNTYQGEGTSRGFGIFCQITISVLPYVATFSEQFYFWRSYLFTLFQSNYFDTTVTFRSMYFFRAAAFLRSSLFLEQSLFSKQLSFQSSYFSRAKHLPSGHFLRIESSSWQLLFRTATILAVVLFKIKISTEELLFPSRYFCTGLTFSEKLHFGK